MTNSHRRLPHDGSLPRLAGPTRAYRLPRNIQSVIRNKQRRHPARWRRILLSRLMMDDGLRGLLPYVRVETDRVLEYLIRALAASTAVKFPKSPADGSRCSCGLNCPSKAVDSRSPRTECCASDASYVL